MTVYRRPTLQGRLTSKGPEGTVEGGTEGSKQDAKHLLASSAQGELVQALDSALSAVAGMFAAALRPHATGARETLDACYEELVTSVEAFRDEVPKA